MKCQKCQADIMEIKGTLVDAEAIHVKPIYGWEPLLGDPHAATIHTRDGIARVFGMRVSPKALGAIEGHEKHFCNPPKKGEFYNEYPEMG